MTTLKASTLVACLVCLGAALHSPAISGVDIATGVANSSDILSNRLQAEESATMDLLATAEANVNSRQDAVEKASTDEERKLAKAALDDAMHMLRNIETASLLLKSAKAYLPAQKDGNAVDEVAGSKGSVEDVSTVKPRKQNSTSTTRTTSTAIATKTATSTRAATARMSPTSTATAAEVTTATTTRLGPPEEEDERGVVGVKDATTQTSSTAEPTKEHATKARKKAASAKKVKLAPKHAAKTATGAGKAPDPTTDVKVDVKVPTSAENLANKAADASSEAAGKDCKCLTPKEAMSCSSKWKPDLVAAAKAGSQCIKSGKPSIHMSWCFTTPACQRVPNSKVINAGKCNIREASGKDCVLNKEPMPQSKKPTGKANAANARAKSVIRSAKEAEAAAKRVMDLATGDAEKRAAWAAVQSAHILINRGKMMQGNAETAKRAIKTMPEKSGTGTVKHRCANATVNEGLRTDVVALTRDSMTVLKKVTIAVPGAKKGLTSLIMALKTATQALEKKLESKASELANGLVEKVAQKASNALRYGRNAVGSKELVLQKHIEDLMDKAEHIESRAKSDEREDVASRIHREAREIREKSVAKDAAAKATRAEKVLKKVIKKASVGAAALSKDLEKGPKTDAQKAKKIIYKSSDMVVKAFGVESQAARVQAVAERRAVRKTKETSLDDASKLSKKAEHIFAKAKGLNEKEIASVKKDLKLAEKRKHALSVEATALRGQVEAKLKAAKASVPKLEKTVQEDIDILKDEIKHAPEKEQRHMAEKELRATKKVQAKADVDKTNVAKIDQAMSKATKDAVLHAGQLKALKEKASNLDRQVKADRETASKKKSRDKKRLVDTVAKTAKKNIAKIKIEAGKVKENAEVAKQVGSGFIKTTPRSAKLMLGDVKKATSLKLESSNEIEEAKKLAREAIKVAADPIHAAKKFKKIARKAELAAQRARNKAREAEQVRKRIASEAKKVLETGEKKLSRKENELQSRADALTKENLEA
eukprot:TRINITY_DN3682_c1_g2_i1.p1 TRINITY_DN3682_c1_g2~~TRINITY_DN3682_c1_g2_i1.p1  ORF type:complete len:1017 (-),score=279.47 TRINITY_DN3682_c1_g2_i1:242-3232(-)